MTAARTRWFKRRGASACAPHRHHLLVAVVLALGSTAAGQVSVPGKPAAPPADQTTASTSRGPSGTIRGRVVHAETGAPLVRALVSLATGSNVQRQVTTDRDGRYQFAELRAGSYTVTATKAGHLSLQYGQRRSFEPGRPVTVSGVEVVGGVDLALPRASVIAGRVTDGRGYPVVGATIVVERYQYGPGGGRRLTRAATAGPAATNDLGEFRAFGLLPGEYVISADVRQLPLPGSAGSDDAAGGFLATYYPGTPNADQAQGVTVGIGQETFVQFAMTRGRLSRITGTVVDSNGRPASGASLMLATVVSTSIGATGRGSGSAAADGSFSIDNVPPGEHFVQARLAARPDGGLEVANARIVATGEDLAGVQITTMPAATLDGRVEWAGTAPRTGTDAALRIVARPSDRAPALIGPIGIAEPGANTTVGADDTFRIGGIIGPVLLAPTGVPPRWTLKAIFVDGMDVTTTSVDPLSFGRDTRVRVVLTDKVSALSGTARTAAGEPSLEYVVVVLPELPVEASVASRYTRTARPDQDGRFTIRDLPAGRYLAAAVTALEDGAEWDPVFQAAVRPRARRFTLAEGQSLALDLELQP